MKALKYTQEAEHFKSRRKVQHVHLFINLLFTHSASTNSNKITLHDAAIFLKCNMYLFMENIVAYTWIIL